MGQSDGWEKTKQGFRNFRLENFYIGAIPIAFALWAIVLAFTPRSLDARRRRDLLFWAGVALVTYLLALGKFFPLYRLFFALPGISSIRNPVKFMQVTQLALGFLAAVGLEHLLGSWSTSLAEPSVRARARKVTYALGGCGLLMGFWAGGLSSSTRDAIATFQSDGWGQTAPAIVGTMVAAIGHGATVMLLAAGGFAAAVFLISPVEQKLRRTLAIILVAAAGVDQLTVSPHYITTITADGYLEENDVVRMLKGSLNYQRPFLFEQSGVYNLWLTYTFPYHDVPTWNVTQLRMPEPYVRYMSAVSQQPQTFWQSCALGYFMGPAGYAQQLMRDGRYSNQFEIAFAFSVFPAVGGGVTVQPGTREQPGNQAVLHYKNDAPRYALVSAWDSLSDDDALGRISTEGYVPFRRIAVAQEDAEGLPAPGAEGFAGEIQVTSYRPGRVVLRVSADRPAVLRASDMYTPDWHATVDGKPALLRRCDYLFQGVFVEAGLHEITLTYRQGLTTFWVQLAGMLACLIAVPAARRASRV